METVLVTGGAGFIGTHLTEGLIKKGYKVIIYDILNPQIHGEDPQIPDSISKDALFVRGDVRDRELLKKSIKESDFIIHLASETGVGQSMYQVEQYTDVIIQGTSVIWDILANESNKIKKVVLSSSRAVYGEGKYNCTNCSTVYPEGRNKTDLEKGIWELFCPQCGDKLNQCATDETSQLKPSSIYAVAKKTQEEICEVMGKALNIPVSILRYQNVYGPRQSLSNPYTGILAIFTSRLKNGKPVEVYEDGLESRDFVHVSDVVKGTILALENKNESIIETYNIANGVKTTVLEIAKTLTNFINEDLQPIITGKFRVGDIRHCYADISKAHNMLGYQPEYNIERGISDFLNWADHEHAIDNSERAESELKGKGLLDNA